MFRTYTGAGLQQQPKVPSFDSEKVAVGDYLFAYCEPLESPAGNLEQTDGGAYQYNLPLSLGKVLKIINDGNGPRAYDLAWQRTESDGQGRQYYESAWTPWKVASPNGKPKGGVMYKSQIAEEFIRPVMVVKDNVPTKGYFKLAFCTLQDLYRDDVGKNRTLVLAPCSPLLPACSPPTCSPSISPAPLRVPLCWG